MTDAEMISGFTGLHDAMSASFAAMQARAKMDERFERLDRRFVALESTLRAESPHSSIACYAASMHSSSAWRVSNDA